MPIKNIDFDSWAEFKQAVFPYLYGNRPFRRGLFFFRGLCSANWALTSSFDRWFDQQGKPEGLRIETADQLLSFFCSEGDGLEALAGIKDRTALLAIAQHYGLPTRLLDWSQSPYVAAFFAFLQAATDARVDEVESGRVAIWALDTQSYLWMPGRSVEIVQLGTTGNARMRNQEGCFTLSRATFRSLEDYVAYEERQGQSTNVESPLIRFTVPDSEAETALAELDGMGLSPVRLYPDLEGCVMAAKLRSRIVNLYSQLKTRAET